MKDTLLKEIETILDEPLKELREQRENEGEEARAARVDQLLSELPGVKKALDDATARVVVAIGERNRLERELKLAETEASRARHSKSQASRKHAKLLHELHDLQGEVTDGSSD